MSQSTKADASYEPVQGPWCALHPDDIMSLAEGTLAEREVRWKNDTLTMTQQHGVRGLSHVPQYMIRPAHALLLAAFEHEEADVRIAALDVLPEFAVRRSDELFDWLSVLLDDEHAGVQKRPVLRWHAQRQPSLRVFARPWKTNSVRPQRSEASCMEGP